MTYAQVTNGQITQVVPQLPTVYAGVTNFNELDAATLQTYGWFAVADPAPPTYDADTQYLTGVTYTPVAGGVQASVAVANLDAASIAASLTLTKADLCMQVDAISNQKCNAGFNFPASGGKPYASDPVAQQRMTMAAIAALGAIGSGNGTAGNLRWANPSQDFVWIAQDGSSNTMDAPTFMEFFTTAVSLGQAFILYSAYLKSGINAAADFPTLRAIDITAGWP